MTICKAVVVVLGAIVHVFAFSYAWATAGASVSFATLKVSNSFYVSSMAAAVLTAGLVSAPIAFALGWLTGKRFQLFTTVSLPLLWLSANSYWRGLPELFGMPSVYSLGAELLVITVIASTSFFVGFRVRSSRVGA